jgi:hypothetical protein
LDEYANAGIPHYWRLEIDGPVTPTAYRLVDRRYRIAGNGTGAVSLSEPAPLEIDVAALLSYRTKT